MGQSPDSKSYNEDGSGLPFFQGNADFGMMYPTAKVWCCKPIKVVDPDTLLISVRAPIGALNFSQERSCIGRGLAGITAKNGVNLKYVYYCLRSKNSELNSKGTGSTFKAITKNALGEIAVRIRNESEQLRIVQTLDEVSDLITLHKQQLNKLDDLIKARFVEMFGDTVDNPFGWEKHKLNEYIDFLTSGSRGWAKYFVDDENELFITIKNVKNNHIEFNDVQYIVAPDNKEAERTKVKAGDLLISITADLGRTGVVDDEIAKKGAYINQHLSLIRLKQERVNPLYISYFLETVGGKRQFERKNQNSVKAGLNFEAIKSLEILVPPKYLQERFLRFVAQVDKSRFAVQKALDETKVLFDSLMQEYFG